MLYCLLIFLAIFCRCDRSKQSPEFGRPGFAAGVSVGLLGNRKSVLKGRKYQSASIVSLTTLLTSTILLKVGMPASSFSPLTQYRNVRACHGWRALVRIAAAYSTEKRSSR